MPCDLTYGEIYMLLRKGIICGYRIGRTFLKGSLRRGTLVSCLSGVNTQHRIQHFGPLKHSDQYLCSAGTWPHYLPHAYGFVRTVTLKYPALSHQGALIGQWSPAGHSCWYGPYILTWSQLV
jgi:hypothetical protein